MKKLLVLLLGTSMFVAACSSTSEPTATTAATAVPGVANPPVVVLSTCEDLQDFVADNHEEIKQAFANNDANTIGRLELQNHAIIQSNLDCFPQIKDHMLKVEKMNASDTM